MRVPSFKEPRLPVTGALAVCALAIVLANCASSSVVRPRVAVEQTSAVLPVRTATDTNVPVTYRLDVSNPLDHDVTLTSIQIETVGLTGSYTMKPVRHAFNQIIKAHTSASFSIRAWVQPLQINQYGRLTSPVMVRGNVQFQSPKGAIRSAFAERLDQ
jgi:hypothetical protein